VLEILEKNRRAIKLAELAAFIHDLDKMEKDFLKDSESHSCSELYTDYKYIDTEKTFPLVKKKKIQSYGLSNIELELTDFNYEFVYSKLLKKNIENGNIDLLSAFIYHHDNDPQENIPIVGQIVHPALCGADGIDSELDKNAIKEQDDDQPFNIDTSFGIKSHVWNSDLHKVIIKLKNNCSIYDLKSLFKNALGETRYPCNDVTLWDHSYSVAGMTKAILVKILLEYNSKIFSKEKLYMLPLRSGKGNDNRTDFTFVKVSIDRSFLLSRGQKAGDIWGISEQVENLQNEIKRVVEDGLLIGNETYSDEDKQLFLIPKLGTWKIDNKNIFAEDIQENFEREVKEKLTVKIENWLISNNCHEFPFAIDFANYVDSEKEKNVSKRILNRSKKLFSSRPECKQAKNCLLQLKNMMKQNTGRCEVCGVRSAKQKEQLCQRCIDRRSNPESNRNRNSRKKNSTSDLSKLINKKEENKLVLISASFDLSKLYDGTIFDKVKIGKEKKNPSLGRLNRSYETLKNFFMDFQEKEVTRIAEYGFFPITTSPQRMEFVIAGKRGDEIISSLYKAYQKNFGKFRDVLPLNIGAIYFYSKFPLYAVLEAEQNMRESFKTKIRKWESEKRIKDPAKFSKIGDSAGYAVWDIDKKLSDGTADEFHKLNFNSEMSEGCFDFVLIDSAAKRHKFTKNKLDHHIFGMRKSYPLSVISDFNRIWTLISKLEKNQISIIENQIYEKIQTWGDKFTNRDDVFRNFCKSVVMSPNAFGKKNTKEPYSLHNSYYPKLLEDHTQIDEKNSNKNLIIRSAQNGLLLDVIDLYIHLENKILEK